MNFREIFIRLVAITTPYLYDNNVSLLELTRKLYEYFHELCTALKSFEDDYSKFKDDTNKNLEDLKAYVDNYFNNLDLSAEVKSVIDSLIADGTLANLINQELLGNINNHLTEIDTELETIRNSIQTNTNDITDLESDNTTNKSNILDLTTRVGTLETDNTTNKSNILDLTTRVGTLETDNTTNKSDITDLKSITQTLSRYINLNHNESFNQSNAVKFPKNSQSFINVASNEDASVCKIYGFLNVDSVSGNTYAEIQTRLRPREDITINSLELIGYKNGNSTWYGNVIIRTTGIVEFRAQNLGVSNCSVTVVPCLLFLKNFGDVDEV